MISSASITKAINYIEKQHEFINLHKRVKVVKCSTETARKCRASKYTAGRASKLTNLAIRHIFFKNDLWYIIPGHMDSYMFIARYHGMTKRLIVRLLDAVTAVVYRPTQNNSEYVACSELIHGRVNLQDLITVSRINIDECRDDSIQKISVFYEGD